MKPPLGLPFPVVVGASVVAQLGVPQDVDEGIGLFIPVVAAEDQRASDSRRILTRLAFVEADSHLLRYTIQSLGKIVRGDVGGSRGKDLPETRLHGESDDCQRSGFAKPGRLDTL